jgi:Zn finger protein HypA/HybF involved in hydrogenase expression
MVEAYCVKCKAKKEMANANEVTMKGKGNVERRAMKGTCPTCGTTMFRILGKK